MPRTSQEILADFDDPSDSTPPLNRDRLMMEVLLDSRESVKEAKDILIECKDELQEIKANTAS